MKRQPKAILEQISQIQEMERGKLCRMRRGPGGDYYNHQTWEQGRNLVRYVPEHQVAGLKKAIAGYQKYLQLTQTYASQIIRLSRLNRKTPQKPMKS